MRHTGYIDFDNGDEIEFTIDSAIIPLGAPDSKIESPVVDTVEMLEDEGMKTRGGFLSRFVMMAILRRYIS